MVLVLSTRQRELLRHLIQQPLTTGCPYTIRVLERMAFRHWISFVGPISGPITATIKDAGRKALLLDMGPNYRPSRPPRRRHRAVQADGR